MQRYYFFLIPANLNSKKKQPITGLPHIKLSTVSCQNAHTIASFLIHYDIRQLHVIGDIHLAVFVQIAKEGGLAVFYDDFTSRNVGVLIACLCGVDGDFVGLRQSELRIIIFLCIVYCHF